MTYKILRADFSVWKHLMYLPLALEAVARDLDSHNPVLFIVAVKGQADAVLTIPFSHVRRLYTQKQHKPFPSIGILPRAAYVSRRGTTFITRNGHHTVWFQSADGLIYEQSKHDTRAQAIKAMKLLHA